LCYYLFSRRKTEGSYIVRGQKLDEPEFTMLYYIMVSPLTTWFPHLRWETVMLLTVVLKRQACTVHSKVQATSRKKSFTYRPTACTAVYSSYTHARDLCLLFLLWSLDIEVNVERPAQVAIISSSRWSAIAPPDEVQLHTSSWCLPR
jgi:hypothetical protein